MVAAVPVPEEEGPKPTEKTAMKPAMKSEAPEGHSESAEGKPASEGKPAESSEGKPVKEGGEGKPSEHNFHAENEESGKPEKPANH